MRGPSHYATVQTSAYGTCFAIRSRGQGRRNLRHRGRQKSAARRHQPRRLVRARDGVVDGQRGAQGADFALRGRVARPELIEQRGRAHAGVFQGQRGRAGRPVALRPEHEPPDSVAGRTDRQKERRQHGAAVHHRAHGRGGRPGVEENPVARGGFHGGHPRGSGRQREGGRGVLPPLPGVDRKPRQGSQALAGQRAVGRRDGRRTAHPEGQRVGENLGVVLADPPGGPGGCHRASESPAAPPVPAGQGVGRVHQPGHGELRVEEPDDLPIREFAGRAGVPGFSRRRAGHPGVPARFAAGH